MRKPTGIRLDEDLISELKKKAIDLCVSYEDLCNRILWKDIESGKPKKKKIKNEIKITG